MVSEANFVSARPLSQFLRMAVMAGVQSAVQVHIDRGDDLNAHDARGMTPLMLSAARNKHAICKLLLSAGADSGLLDPSGKTALEIAMAPGASESARILGATVAPPPDCAGSATAPDPVSGRDIGESPPRPESVCWPSQVIELDDGGAYDLLATVPAAGVAGQFDGAVHNAHRVLIDQHADGAPYLGVGHRVVVQVEAHVRCLAHRHGQALAQRELALGQRQQARLLGLEGLAYAQGGVLGPAPIGGQARAPRLGLRVQVVQVGEGAPGEEAVADEADRAFDAALLVSPRMSAVGTVKQPLSLRSRTRSIRCAASD
ncbi:MAG: ankyrin repeat domain-containing protein [Proteobacteria bacterium]|nr:ankyrin repeat domain-containing protein [Pseudomonadota bacterium]